MIIIGIDPGTTITGYGVIESEKNGLEIIDYGCILTEPSLTTAERLKETDRQFVKLLNKHKPQKIAVEDIFFFKNAKTVIKVSQARGVILFRASKMLIPIFEYTPLQVKQAVTGYGRADKKQVQQMVKTILNLEEIPQPDDAADALAIAICCAHTNNF
ncbi:MAG: crossover junction endodeoxyribonuclease RuvC [Patescibacteria group bacterium]|nr:crossover junction endodeoxyribonuclease RuvC [Patescibacteria group bacterium]